MRTAATIRLLQLRQARIGSRADEDEFSNLVERTKPDYREKIRELFAAGRPDLATLEADVAGCRIADAFGEVEVLEELVEPARNRFQTVTDKMQRRFIEAIGKEGWPVGGRLRATQVLDNCDTLCLVRCGCAAG
jgi:hypothetical protein